MAKHRTKVQQSDVLTRVFQTATKRLRRKFLKRSGRSTRDIKKMVHAWIKENHA